MLLGVAFIPVGLALTFRGVYATGWPVYGTLTPPCLFGAGVDRERNQERWTPIVEDADQISGSRDYSTRRRICSSRRVRMTCRQTDGDS